MIIEPLLITHMQTIPALTALIGTTPMRAFPDVIPLGANDPCMTYQTISGTSEPRVNDGKSSLRKVRWGLRIRAKQALHAAQIGDVLKQSMIGLKLQHAGITVVKIESELLDRSEYDPATATYWRLLDLPIWIQGN